MAAIGRLNSGHCCFNSKTAISLMWNSIFFYSYPITELLRVWKTCADMYSTASWKSVRAQLPQQSACLGLPASACVNPDTRSCISVREYGTVGTVWMPVSGGFGVVCLACRKQELWCSAVKACRVWASKIHYQNYNSWHVYRNGVKFSLPRIRTVVCIVWSMLCCQLSSFAFL